MGKLRSLKALILNNNSELEYASGLDRCRALETLILSHCAVQELGSWLAGCHTLVKLSVSHNSLVTDSKMRGLRGCTALQELRMSHCSLKALPIELEACRKLRIVEAGGNDIEHDIDVLANLPDLRQLSLKGCPIASKENYKEKIGQLCPDLEILDNRRLIEKKRNKSKIRHADVLEEEKHGTHLPFDAPADIEPQKPTKEEENEGADDDSAFAQLTEKKKKKKIEVSQPKEAGVVKIVQGKPSQKNKKNIQGKNAIIALLSKEEMLPTWD